jgi:uncharacterized membrane protein
MKSPQRYSPFHLLLFLMALGTLMILIQFGAISIAFDRLGLSPQAALLVLLSSLVGSFINIPVLRVEVPGDAQPVDTIWSGLLRHTDLRFQGSTLICINLGGCVIPLAVCLYLLLFRHPPLAGLVMATVCVTLISYLFSRPIKGIGIAMPIIVAPLTAALAAIILTPAASPVVAYIAGVTGVLLGADVLRLGTVRELATPIASIGGAGTFDGIFITGLIAVLLA